MFPQKKEYSSFAVGSQIPKGSNNDLVYEGMSQVNYKESYTKGTLTMVFFPKIAIGQRDEPVTPSINVK